MRESLRNVAVIANRGAGKTSLAEAMLFTTGGIPTLGSMMQGTTVSDFEPEEIHHRSSVSTSLLRCTWNHTTINLLDTPGALSLLGEAITALQAADAVIVVLGPASGIRSELVRLWSQVKALGLPCLIFVNELEKECRARWGIARGLPSGFGSRRCRCRACSKTGPSGWAFLIL